MPSSWQPLLNLVFFQLGNCNVHNNLNYFSCSYLLYWILCFLWINISDDLCIGIPWLTVKKFWMENRSVVCWYQCKKASWNTLKYNPCKEVKYLLTAVFKAILEIENVLGKEFATHCDQLVENKLSVRFGEDKTKCILFALGRTILS